MRGRDPLLGQAMAVKNPWLWGVVALAVLVVGIIWQVGSSSTTRPPEPAARSSGANLAPPSSEALPPQSGRAERANAANSGLDSSSQLAAKAAERTESAELATPVPEAQPLRASRGGDGWALDAAASTKAVVRVGDRSIEPLNVGGHYQRLKLPRGTEASITVKVPADDPSPQLLVRAIQGGTINGAENYAVYDLSRGDQEVTFTFRGGTDPGLSEVILRRGSTEEVMQFWTPTADPEYDPPSLSLD